MTTATLKLNKFPAACSRCAVRVEAGLGSIERVDGKWITTCLDGETCGERADAADVLGASVVAATEASYATTALDTVPEGVYAVEDRLYQFDHPQDYNWAGWIFVKRVEMRIVGMHASGKPKVKKTKLGKAASVKPGCGAKFFGTQAAADLAIIVADPLEAAKLVGKTTAVCGRCSTGLEDPVSVERGIGPVCWKKWGLG